MSRSGSDGVPVVYYIKPRVGWMAKKESGTGGFARDEVARD